MSDPMPESYYSMNRGYTRGPPPAPPPKTRRSRPSMEDEREMMEPDMQNTSHMKFVDGRCSCCPYGYHIDLDFMRYLEGLNSGSTLHDLKKIHRDKKKLRKSMEVFLRQQEMALQSEGNGPPPDVVHSSENFINILEKDESATTEILEEIDSSVSQTLSSIDLLMHSGGQSQHMQQQLQHQQQHQQQQHMTHQQHQQYLQQQQLLLQQQQYSDYITDSDLESPSPTRKTHFVVPPTERDLKYRAEAEMMLSQPNYGLGKSDSISSLSSQSTFSGEQFSNQHSSTTTTHRTFVTSVQLADNMASLFSGLDQTDGSVSSASLQAIRQQMAISLQRMRELEEQVKAIPVLQVRISVLKEEKRLLMLQLKAKNSKLNMRSVGIGDARVDDPNYGINMKHLTQMNLNLMNGDINNRTRPAMRSIGVGDFNAEDNALIQMVGGYATTVKLHERELHTEANTHVHEKEIKTVFLSQGSESADDSLSFRPKVAPKPPRKPSRSIGVGEGNVFDSSSNVHFHQKELRTVFIGDEAKDKPMQRNVGILCKAATRDVGVTYMYEDELPSTRSIAVGVGEMGMDGTLMLAGEGEDGEGGWASSSSTTVHNTMQSMNMAAFHTKHIHIKDEVLRMIIDEKLKKTVNSKATQCRFATNDKSTMVKGLESKVSIGVGSDTIDVKVEPIKQMRSIGVENRPTVMSRSSITDKMYRIDVGTNTYAQIGTTMHRATNTAQVLTYPAATNTDKVILYNANTETDKRVFQSLGLFKTTSSNTVQTRCVDTASNTLHNRQLVDQNFDFSISFRNAGTYTDPGKKHTWERGTSTPEIRMYEKSVNTQPVPTFAKAVNTEKRTNLIHRGTITDSPRLYSKGVGDECVLQSPFSPSSSASESIIVKKVVETENARNISRNVPVRPKTTHDNGEENTTYGVKVGFTVDKYSSPSLTKSSNVSSSLDKDFANLEREIHQGRSSSSVDNMDSVDHGMGSQDKDGLSRTITKEVVRKTESKLGSVRGTGDSSWDGNLYSRNTGKDSRFSTDDDKVSGSTGGGGQMYSTTTVISKDSRMGSSGRGDIHSRSGIGGSDGGSQSSSTIITKESMLGRGQIGRNESQGGSGSTYTTNITTESKSRSLGGSEDIIREGGHQYGSDSSTHMMAQMMGGASSGGSRSGGSGSYSKVTTTTTKSSRGGGNLVPKQQQHQLMYESDDTQSQSSTASGGGNSEFVMETGEDGQTKMRIIRNVETTYVGSTPVLRSTNVVLRTPEGSPHDSNSDLSKISPTMQGVNTFSYGQSSSGGGASSHEFSSTSSKSASSGGGGGSISVDRSGMSSGGMSVSGGSMSSGGGMSSGGMSVSGGSMSSCGGMSVSGGSMSSGGGMSSGGMSVSGGSMSSCGGMSVSGGSMSSGGGMSVSGGGMSVTGGGMSSSMSSSNEGSSGGGLSVSGGGFGSNINKTTSRTVTRTVNGQIVEQHSSSSNDGRPAARESRTTVMQDSGITMDTSPEMESQMMEFPESMNMTSYAMLHGGSTGGTKGRVITQSRVERRQQSEDSGNNGGLKSIMKHPGETVRQSRADQNKKEISFSEDVVGGYQSSSAESLDEDEEEINDDEDDDDDDDDDEAKDESQESEGESEGEESFDEGSYDGRQGKIVYTCKDNEAIETGVPGAAMYDQNIRETFELGAEMQNACEVYAQFLEDSTQVSSKQLNSSLNLIQQEWFKISSHKLSNPSQVEDYLTCFNEFSRHLLVNIVNMADANGNTALHYAVSHCNMDIVNLLLDTELCEVNKQNKAGYTAIMLGSLTQIQTDSDRGVIRRLFNMGDVNAQASQAGQTALMLAVSHGRQDMVKMLIECGGNVNIQDEDGSTALMCASEHGHTEIVKMLLAHPDCDPTLTDNDGSTALSIAMEASHRDIGVLLYAHVNFKQNSPA